MKAVVFRQGDVLIRSVPKPPESLQDIPRDAGRIVLAYGEVTGHSHAIASDQARFLINEQTQQRYVEVKAEYVALNHEEHSEIQLPSGFWEVTIQREYDPTTMSRAVVD